MTQDSARHPFIEAISLLTSLPVSGDAGSGVASAAAWFPVVGLLLFGLPAALALLLVLGLSRGFDPLVLDVGLGRHSLLLAALVVAGWALFSRYLHWDALADTGDACWGGKTVEDRLRIMRDSTVGAYGVVSIVLVAAIQISALASVAEYSAAALLPVLVATPALGRLSATFAAWFGAPARQDGAGRHYLAKPRLSSVSLVVITLVAVFAVGCFGDGFAPLVWGAVVVVTLVAAALFPHVLARRFGGVTGDVMGASVLSTEAVMLVAAALSVGVR